MNTICFAVLATVAATLTSRVGQAAAADPRPNIVFFYADDWGRVASCYADPARPSPSDVVETPNIDRVAREGVRFENAFFPCPQCTPCRGSLITGNYFWRCGSAANLQGGEWKTHPDPLAALPKFPPLLADSGYHTDRQHKTLGFTPTRGTGAGAVYPVGEFLRYGMHVSGGETASARDRRHRDVVDQTRNTILRALAERPADKPFFFVFGPINTHRPYVRGSGRALWGIEPDALKGKLPAFLPDVPEVREDMADYLGEVRALDLMLGVFLEELRKAGVLDGTLLVLAGDNGPPGFPRGKTQLYDLGTAAPLIVRWPGRVKAGRTSNDLVNLMDLAPTFLEIAGVKPPASMDGRSLVPQLLADRSGAIDPTRDHVIFGRERHYGTARAGNLPYPARAIRTRDFLYIRNFKPDRWPMGDPFGVTDATAPSDDALRDDTAATFRDLDASPTKAWVVSHRDDADGEKYYEYAFAKRPAEELYDLRKDPDQLHSVAAEAAYAGPKRELADRLSRVMRATKDPRLDDAFDRPPYVEEVPASAGRRKRGPAAKKVPKRGARP